MMRAFAIAIVMVERLLLPEVLQAQTTLAPDSARSVERTSNRIFDLSGLEEPGDWCTPAQDDPHAADQELWIREHPYDLNTISLQQLQSLPGVTPFEAKAVIELKDRLGQYASVDDLDELESGIERKLRPYVFPAEEKQPPGNGPALQIRSRFSGSSPATPRSVDPEQSGNPIRSYGSLLVRPSESVEFGGLFQKDAWEKTKYALWTGYCQLHDVGFISRVVVGDYAVDAGQGLVLWNAGGAIMSGPAGIGGRQGVGARPYHSTGESGLLRGVAVSMGFPPASGILDFTLFYSFSRRAGNVNEAGEVTGFYRDGLFRTEGEIAKRSAIGERILGGRMEYTPGALLAVGLTYYAARFDREIQPEGADVFAGHIAEIGGLDFRLTMKNVSLVGEFARSENKGTAGMFGATIGFGRESVLAASFRSFGAAFTDLHAHPYGSTGNGHNEQGVSVGLEVAPARWLVIKCMMDHFRQPWRTALNPLPTHGQHLFLEANAAVTSRLTVAVRLSGGTTETFEPVNDDLGRAARATAAREELRGRVTLLILPHSRFRIKGRGEITSLHYSGVLKDERGILLLHEVEYETLFGITLNGRIAFFDTGSYDSRMYAREGELRGNYENLPMYGSGRHWYIMVGWRLWGGVRLSAKYARTEWDRRVTSSGDDAINEGGDRWGMQVDVEL